MRDVPTTFFSLLILLLLTSALTRAQNVCPSDCPKFEVTSDLQIVKAGEIVEFIIESDDRSVLEGKFEWKVSLGTIVSGQGTSKIAVKTSEEMLKPEPPPTPLPGHVVSLGNHGRRLAAITAFAKLIDEPRCSCLKESPPVRVGTRTVHANRPADITDLRLSTHVLALACEPGWVHRTGHVPSKSMVVDLSVTATDPENDVLTFDYQVSAGRIIGRGSKVKWDLSGVDAGTYSVTVGADDGCGICGKTLKETVTVFGCDPPNFDCAEIWISGPDKLEPRSLQSFVANISGGVQVSVRYTWTVINAEIVAGQGSPSITVKTGSDADKKDVSVSVRYGGFDPRANCLDSVTKEFHNGQMKP